MVNKIAVILVGGIVVIGVVAVGGVVALVFTTSSSGGTQTPTAVDATPLPDSVGGTATAVGTSAGTATGSTETPTPASATPTPRSVPPSEFNETRIEILIEREINDRRRALQLDPLARNSSSAEDLTRMAREHSASMARIGAANHTINGTSSADRYRQYELYSACKFKIPGQDSFARPDNNGYEVTENGFEAIDRTVAGRPYEVDGETRFNADERDVATTVVDTWWNASYPSPGPDYRKRLTFENATSIGVGVEVTQYGEVYATANVC